MMVTVASVASRPVFWHFVVWLKVLWYALAVLSVGVFVFGLARPLAKYRHGHGGWVPARSAWPRLFAHAIRDVASHVTIGRRHAVVGWAHRAIFYGFLVLFAGTVILGFDTDFTQPVFGWSYFHGEFYLAYKEVLNFFGTALVVGLVVMMVRRARRLTSLDYTRPDRAEGDSQYDRRIYRAGDWAFVGMLLIITLTGFLLEGVRIAMTHPGYAGTQFAGWGVAQLLAGLNHQALASLRHGVWWFHGLLAIGFVASIPYTKAAHMFESFMSLALRDPLAGKRLRGIPSERAALPAGYATLVDFSPVHLLQLDACTKCGRCHDVCPAHATGRPLSPRDVILELREQANAAMSGTGIGGVIGQLLDGRDDDSAFMDPVIGDSGVRVETLWSCMQCNACVEVCPVGIEQAPIINQLRRHLVEEGQLDGKLQATLETIHRSGNSFGENRRKRGRWTDELDFDVPDARTVPVDVLWFVGDYASFDPRSQRVTRALARLFHHAEVSFGILYDGEQNSGNDVRRVGEEGLFEALAEQNIAALHKSSFNRIVTSDPHSLNTLRNEYPELGGTWPVDHHTAFLLELIDDGRLGIREPLGYRVTYHDPCYLGRYNGGYDAPRRILEALGCVLIEMPRNRENSFCCGAGGGRIWIPDQPGQERPSENRIREAVALPDVELFVVACPKDVTMYEDAIKTSGSAGQIELRELTELIGEALAATGVPTVQASG
jgi:Fe-S oxidoreductase/cytochrome b561